MPLWAVPQDCSRMWHISSEFISWHTLGTFFRADIVGSRKLITILNGRENLMPNLREEFVIGVHREGRTDSPVLRPILTLSFSLGMWRMRKVLTASRKASDMLATSRAWLSPLRTGSPDTTMYASPMVSTLKSSKVQYVSFDSPQEWQNPSVA